MTTAEIPALSLADFVLSIRGQTYEFIIYTSVDPLSYPLVDPQLFGQCYDEIHDQ